jgi:hypothetical protein
MNILERAQAHGNRKQKAFHYKGIEGEVKAMAQLAAISELGCE